mgnify:CR=1 FL=1
MPIRLVAWDYDGVLNRDETDFDRVARDFDAAFGLSFRSFVDFHFTGTRTGPVSRLTKSCLSTMSPATSKRPRPAGGRCSISPMTD